jgi:YggT family protein
MIISVLINLVRWIGSALMVIVILDIVLSYFLSPYHPIRKILDTIVRPLLRPIQRIVPPLGVIDFSPIILIILIQVLESLLIMLLAAIR